VAVFPVILDSDVVFGINSTDLLMSLGHAGMFRPHWTKEILDGAERNILKVRPGIDPAQLRLRFDAMNEAIPDALIEVPSGLETTMSNHPGDRHVVAAAVFIGAPTIVTNNLKHFLPEDCEPYGVEAQSADVFVEHLVSLNPAAVRDVFVAIANRRRPPESVAELVNNMRGTFPPALAALDAAIVTALESVGA
jgi:hypothetical protein